MLTKTLKEIIEKLTTDKAELVKNLNKRAVPDARADINQSFETLAGLVGDIPVFPQELNIENGTDASGEPNYGLQQKTSSTDQKNRAYGLYSMSLGKGSVAQGECAYAEGYETDCYGTSSHTEGYRTRVDAEYAHAEGYNSQAKGTASHAEGYSYANGGYTHAEGNGSQAEGYASHAEGYNNTSEGNYSHVSGYKNTANEEAQTVVGKYNNYSINNGILFQVGNGTSDDDRSNAFSVTNKGTMIVPNYNNATDTDPDGYAEIKCVGGGFGSSSIASGTGTDSIIQKNSDGSILVASGPRSAALNRKTTASGPNSLAENYKTEAHGDSSHAEGVQTKTYAKGSHAEGVNTISGVESENKQTFWGSHAEGYGSQALYAAAHAEGSFTIAGKTGELNNGSGSGSGSGSGEDSEDQNVDGINYEDLTSLGSHSEGISTKARGNGSHAEGQGTLAIGDQTHAEGYKTMAGIETDNITDLQTFGTAHAEGSETKASNYAAHAEGIGTKASGAASHAEGAYTEASGENSHASGGSTVASHRNSFVTGDNNHSTNEDQFVCGVLAKRDEHTEEQDKTLFVVGNGTDTSNNVKFSNAFEVYKDGHIEVQNERQMEALNSGITSNDVGKIKDHDIKIDALYKMSLGQIWDLRSYTDTTYSKIIDYGTKMIDVKYVGGKIERIVPNEQSSENFDPYLNIGKCNKISINSQSSDHPQYEYIIPEEIVSLDGYGWYTTSNSLKDPVYNYIDFETKTFHKKVGRFDLYDYRSQFKSISSFGWTSFDFQKAGINIYGDTDVICHRWKSVKVGSAAQMEDKTIGLNYSYTNIYVCDKEYIGDISSFRSSIKQGTYVYYVLDTEEVIDISQYLTSLPIIPVIENNSTITFEQQNSIEHGPIQLELPNKLDYYIQLSEVQP